MKLDYEKSNPPTKIFFADLDSSRLGASIAAINFGLKTKGKQLSQIFDGKLGGRMHPLPPRFPRPWVYVMYAFTNAL